MRLRNKKTGEIVGDGYVRETHDFQFDGQKHVLAVFKGNGHRPPERVSGAYKSLAELNAEWEDAPEEPEGIKNIEARYYSDGSKVIIEYSSKEEAIDAYEKACAWKRLKDNGLVVKKWTHTPDMHLTTGSFLKIEGFIPAIMNNIDDLDLLFGGEE